MCSGLGLDKLTIGWLGVRVYESYQAQSTADAAPFPRPIQPPNNGEAHDVDRTRAIETVATGRPRKQVSSMIRTAIAEHTEHLDEACLGFFFWPDASAAKRIINGMWKLGNAT